MALGKLVRCFLSPPLGSGQSRGSGFEPQSPGWGSCPGSTSPLAFPRAACSQRSDLPLSPASWPSALMKHLMYTQGCSYEMELVGEPLKCIYSLRPMLLTLLDASGCTVCEVSGLLQVRKGSLCELAALWSQNSAAREAIVAFMMLSGLPSF